MEKKEIKEFRCKKIIYKRNEENGLFGNDKMNPQNLQEKLILKEEKSTTLTEDQIKELNKQSLNTGIFYQIVK